MDRQPLTHHEILSIVGPFTRRGRHVDLAASDRNERRLLFKPVDHPAAGAQPALREVLKLEQHGRGRWRLTRLLTEGASGLEAALRVDGSDLEALLAAVEAVDAHSHFRQGAGYTLAFSHDLEMVRGRTRRTLVLGEARVDGLTLLLRTSNVAGMPADLELQAPLGEPLDLPEDLLAVLGWAWRRLTRKHDGWRSLVKLSRFEPARSRDAERKLERAAEHLARTLAEPPAAFHDRLLRARWGVTFRRALPLALAVAALAASPLLLYIELSDDSLWRMVIFNAPPLLMVAFFSLHEMPRFEIPPAPKRPTALSWRAGPAVTTAPAGVMPAP
ncbi:MAG: hypothetical protein MUE62_05585 [Burkholderiaceae bacterium]|jgi:hypothetical protein|nr:hypothetical protein [Burkholderiaceae bacterium]